MPIPFADCPFSAAFEAAGEVFPLVCPDGDDLTLLSDYGFAGGMPYVTARVTIAAGRDGVWADSFADMVEALKSVQSFMTGYEEALRGGEVDCEAADAWLAAENKVAVACLPAMLDAARAGRGAGYAAYQPGAGPFPGAAALAAAGGFSGASELAFLSGFYSALPRAGVQVDLRSGALVCCS